MSRVTVIGATVVDLVFELPAAATRAAAKQHYWRLNLGEKIRGRSHLSVGGTGANVAVGLSRLGLKVTLHTALSSDALGQLLFDRLKEEGVSVVIQKMSGSPPLSVILPTVGDRTIITDRQVGGEYLADKWPGTGWLHLGSFPPEAVDIYQRLVDHLASTGSPLSLNPSEEILAAKPRVFRLALAKTTVLFVNRREGLYLTGSPRTVSSGDLARALLRFGPKIVCLTDGERSARVATRDMIISALPLTATAGCLDATGAGDAFTSGFLSELIRSDRRIFDRRRLSQALRLAQANAGSVVLTVGAQEGLLDSRQAARQGKLVKVEEDG